MFKCRVICESSEKYCLGQSYNGRDLVSMKKVDRSKEDFYTHTDSIFINKQTIYIIAQTISKTC